MFSGKTVVITGASSGLGKALASALAAEGANLALMGRDAEKLGSVAESCRARGGGIVELAGDVVDAADCERFLAAALELSLIHI